MLPGFLVYKTFIALKNHFVLDSYNYVRYHGKTTVKVETYLKRKDRFFFEKLGRNMSSEEELRDHIIANLVHGTSGLQIDPAKVWIGDLTTTAARTKALDYMAKKQSLDYFVKKDLTTIVEYIRMRDQSGAKSSSAFPLLLTLYYEGTIYPETLIIVDKIFGDIFDTWSKSTNVGNDPVWEKTKKFLMKYSAIAFYETPIDVTKYKAMYLDIMRKTTI